MGNVVPKHCLCVVEDGEEASQVSELSLRRFLGLPLCPSQLHWEVQASKTAPPPPGQRSCCGDTQKRPQLPYLPRLPAAVVVIAVLKTATQIKRPGLTALSLAPYTRDT